LHCNEQQSVDVMQNLPSGEQLGGPHTPPLHCNEQQSVGPAQSLPSGTQSGPSQTLLLHWPEQQSLAAIHDELGPPHCVPHVPLALQICEQH
jgi:hypothetical protein